MLYTVINLMLGLNPFRVKFGPMTIHFFFFFGSGLEFSGYGLTTEFVNLLLYFSDSLVSKDPKFLFFTLQSPISYGISFTCFDFPILSSLYMTQGHIEVFFFFASKRGALLRKCPLLILAILIYVHTYLLLRNYIKLNLLMRSSELKLHLYI